MNRLWQRNQTSDAGWPAGAEDDAALARRMEEAALSMPARGTARPGISLRERRRLEALRMELRRFGDVEAGDTLRPRLERELAATLAALPFGGGKLPACEGDVRVERLAQTLCRDGETPLTEARLMRAVAAFDEAQPLTMAELWAVPSALRTASARGLMRCAELAARRARAAASAEAWVRRVAALSGDGAARHSARNSGGKAVARAVPAQVTPAFVERAVKLAAEAEIPGAREALARALQKRGLSVEAMVRRAHAERSQLEMRLEHLSAARRLADEMDWQAAFQTLCAAEQALCRDPAGVYPRMDEASRADVRDCVAVLARKTGLTELAVVEYALQAAEEAARRMGKTDVPTGEEVSKAPDKTDLPTAEGASEGLDKTDIPPAEGASEGLIQSDVPTAEEAAEPLKQPILHLPSTTVCFHLADDAGRRALLARMGCASVRLRWRIPDPSGRRTVAALLGLTAMLLTLFLAWTGRPFLWPLGLVLCWSAADALVGRLFPLAFPPARLLKLEFQRLPDEWRTLVALPVLLTDGARVDAACDRLEALGCLEDDPNAAFLLLGDFADADRAHLDGDAELVRRARRRVDALNRRAGRRKYACLIRPRTLLKADSRWMGRDRKRGALMDLNRLLLGEPGAEAAFSACGGDCGWLKGRFACVLTLDADTRMIPGTLHRLAGALAHPMNRRYAVLQPRMETLPSACVNGFARLFSGYGGVDAYPVAASSLWQDLTGTGLFGGKGIYRVAAFQRALAGALPEGRVLSHDLIEGALAGAGFVDDVCLYDDSPATLSSALRRLHRWTRGDWQLLPFLLRRRPMDNGARLRAADRFRMADNLARSLRSPARLAVLLLGAAMGDAAVMTAGLADAALEPLLGGDALRWRRAVAALGVLPQEAFCQLDAAARALWRTFVSGRHLMDWVTAADAESGARTRREPLFLTLPGVAAAAAALSGLGRPDVSAGALGLALLFLAGRGFTRDLERAAAQSPAPLTPAQRGEFQALARQTWQFFEACVPMDGGPGIPPDNVQLDPAAPPVRRTSPTNIALYMMSCVAARELGFIDEGAALHRLHRAADALERAEKWRGHLYNWTDLDTLSALRPRYVSSVDSGNLAAALLTCARSVGDVPLAEQLEALARNMDFTALYDERRELFAIGMDGETGARSQSRYDLLASEARILSFTAMMLGQAPVKHWRRLGRACAAVEGRAALCSWSGTMFETLMPTLFMGAPEGSLLGESARAVVAAQREWGRRNGRPWGVSESGYYAFDGQMNYQYRAFGLPALALSGEVTADVVAPYASALAAPLAPEAVRANLRGMRAALWAGEWGFYEAADYLRRREDGAPSLVKSHMAHHQGMILCALCNALTGDGLRRAFMDWPQARALAPLLEERACPPPARRARRVPGEMPPRRSAGRMARGDRRLVETHILTGDGASAVLTADGGAHYRRFGVDATRFSGDLIDGGDGARVFLRNLTTGEAAMLGEAGMRVRFWPGEGEFALRMGAIEARMRAGISPEDGTLMRALTLENRGVAPAQVLLTDVAPVALARPEDFQAHAAFQDLFVVCERLAPNALAFRRRPRNPGERCPTLVHMALSPEKVCVEADRQRLCGRMRLRACDVPILSDGADTGLHPVSALQTRLTLTPGRPVRVHFALALLGEDAPIEAWLRRCMAQTLPERALRLSRAQAEAMLDFLGLTDEAHGLIQRLAALVLDARLTAQARRDGGAGLAEGAPHPRREDLWRAGISGDRPILFMPVRSADQAAAVRLLMRAHAFYRGAGIFTDLVLVDDAGGGYRRDVRHTLDGMIDAGALGGLRGAPGGVFLLDGETLAPQTREALSRAAAIALTGAGDFAEQARALLSALNAPKRETAPVLDVGEMGTAKADDSGELNLAGARSPSKKGDEGRAASRRTLDNGLGGFLPGGGTNPVGARPASEKEDEGSAASRRALDNGLGGFLPGGGYEVDVRAHALPPMPWCNILAEEAGGALLSERGGGFFWHGSSRFGRLTAFGGDPLREAWGMMLYLRDARTGALMCLLPGERPTTAFRVRFDGARAAYTFGDFAGEDGWEKRLNGEGGQTPASSTRLSGEEGQTPVPSNSLSGGVTFFVTEDGAVCADVSLVNHRLPGERCELIGFVDWLMGALPGDAALLRCRLRQGVCLAEGAMDGVGYFALSLPGARGGADRAEFLGRGGVMSPEGVDAPARGGGWVLRAPIALRRGVPVKARFALGWAEDAAGALAAARAVCADAQALPRARARWQTLADRMTFETPNPALNALANGFLLHQTRAARVLGRTGFYQPGGACGFRDQLQDMLLLMHYEPQRARAHLLTCAARQFEAGDVLHWWHSPFRGVRTRISDDRLFLPWVTAAYVRLTGDAEVLAQRIPYLEDSPIPSGRDELYDEMRPGAASDTLHGHCMRALRSVARSDRGLALMGAGDWNDGMNRVGAAGRGESVWLTEFLAACARRYAEIAPDRADAAQLRALADDLCAALEKWAWDGAWYLRAWTDDGAPLGTASGSACQIDAIAQAWAVLAGLSPRRCRRAMDSAWRYLADEDAGTLALLTPPFDGGGIDPGYLKGYPPGVRENGAQYTHGALWLLLAWIALGDADKAHRALNLLLPANHADTPEKAARYRVEPYVMAADVCTAPGMAGRGGWTWYTGAAAWMHECLLALLGYERRGDAVRLNALLGEWPSAGITLRWGKSRWRLISERGRREVTLDGAPVPGGWVTLRDDGRDHEARFGCREAEE